MAIPLIAGLAARVVGGSALRSVIGQVAGRGLAGGISRLLGGGKGLAGLGNPLKLFGDLASKLLGGKLGGSTPTLPGFVKFPFPQPPAPPSTGGPQLTSSENKLIGRFGGLEKQMNGLLDKLNKGDKMSQAELAQIQTQLSKISNMMKQITSILNQIQDTMKNIIQNIRA